MVDLYHPLDSSSGYLIYRITYQLTGEKYCAILSRIFPFSVHYVYRWAVYNRVDMLAYSLVYGALSDFRQSNCLGCRIAFFAWNLYQTGDGRSPIAAFL